MAWSDAKLLTFLSHIFNKTGNENGKGLRHKWDKPAYFCIKHISEIKIKIEIQIER